MMDSYYSNQLNGPHFAGHYRQRGSGFGALALGIGRVALPIARKFILPTAKKVGRELLSQAVPEIMNVFAKKQTPKKALKNVVKKTVKKQLGGGRRGVAARKQKIIKRKYKQKRSRSDFFSKVKHNDR